MEVVVGEVVWGRCVHLAPGPSWPAGEVGDSSHILLHYSGAGAVPPSTLLLSQCTVALVPAGGDVVRWGVIQW